MTSASSSWAQSTVTASGGVGGGGDELIGNSKRNEACLVNTQQSCWFWPPRRAELMARASAFVRATEVELGGLSPSTSAVFNISWPAS